MKFVTLALSLMLAAPAVFAGGAKFRTPDATGVVRTSEDLTLTSIQGVAWCHFEDGSGFGSDDIGKDAPTVFAEIQNDPGELGRAYEVTVKAVNFQASKTFVSVNKCGYDLAFEGVTTNQEGPVEGSVNLYYHSVVDRKDYKLFLDNLEAKVKSEIKNVRVKTIKGFGFEITKDRRE